MKKTEKFFCCICTGALDEYRVIHKAVTCSKACAQELRRRRRRRADLKSCRYCGAPSTPEERRLFKQWRDTMPKRKRGRPPLQKPEKNEVAPLQAEFTEMMHVT